MLRRYVYTVLVTLGLIGLLGWIGIDSEEAVAGPTISALAVPPGAASQIKPLTTGAFMDGFGVWAPDGKQIAFMRDGQIRLIAPTGGAPKKLTGEDGFWDAVSAWRPDGKLLAFVRLSAGGESAGDGASIMLVEPGTGKLKSLRTESQPIGHVAWAPDGKSLFYTTPQQLMRLDATTGRPEEILSVDADWEMLAGGLAVSPDGKRLAYGAGPRSGRGVQYELWHLDLAGEAPKPVRLTQSGGIMPAYDGKGQRLAYRSPRKEPGIYIMDLVTREAERVVPDEERALFFHPAFSPDGKRLLLSRLLLGQGEGGRFTSHLYLHTLSGSGGD